MLFDVGANSGGRENGLLRFSCGMRPVPWHGPVMLFVVRIDHLAWSLQEISSRDVLLLVQSDLVMIF